MNETGRHASPAFLTTRWTQVREARGDTPAARAALGELCAAYWIPVYRFLLREGRGEDDARELTQEFFARLLKGGVGGADPGRGKFRSYLLGAVRHFLGDVSDRASRQKRGGGVVAESLSEPDPDGSGAGLQVEDPNGAVGDAHFDRQWALAILDRSLTELELEMESAGKRSNFEVLQPWLVGESNPLEQVAAACRLGMGEGALKVAIHRLRKRFRVLVRDEIARTVSDPGDVDVELQYFVEVLASAK